MGGRREGSAAFDPYFVLLVSVRTEGSLLVFGRPSAKRVWGWQVLGEGVGGLNLHFTILSHFKHQKHKDFMHFLAVETLFGLRQAFGGVTGVGRRGSPVYFHIGLAFHGSKAQGAGFLLSLWTEGVWG